MTTKSLTQGRPHRTREEIDADIGKEDIPDAHPLICCAPHIMGGHAHLKSNKITVERALISLMNQRETGPLKMSNGFMLSDEEVRAVYAYAIDVFAEISKLYAELGRLRQALPRNVSNEKTKGKGP